MQRDVDAEFEKMIGMSRIADMENVVRNVLRLEGESRNAMADGRPEDAGAPADEAYRLFMGVPALAIPTLIMGLADHYNQMREMFDAVLDRVRLARLEVEEADRLLDEGEWDLAHDRVAQALDILPEFEEVEEP